MCRPPHPAFGSQWTQYRAGRRRYARRYRLTAFVLLFGNPTSTQDPHRLRPGVSVAALMTAGHLRGVRSGWSSQVGVGVRHLSPLIVVRSGSLDIAASRYARGGGPRDHGSRAELPGGAVSPLCDRDRSVGRSTARARLEPGSSRRGRAAQVSTTDRGAEGLRLGRSRRGARPPTDARHAAARIVVPGEHSHERGTPQRSSAPPRWCRRTSGPEQAHLWRARQFRARRHLLVDRQRARPGADHTGRIDLDIVTV